MLQDIQSLTQTWPQSHKVASRLHWQYLWWTVAPWTATLRHELVILPHTSRGRFSFKIAIWYFMQRTTTIEQNVETIQHSISSSTETRYFCVYLQRSFRLISELWIGMRMLTELTVSIFQHTPVRVESVRPPAHRRANHWLHTWRPPPFLQATMYVPNRFIHVCCSDWISLVQLTLWWSHPAIDHVQGMCRWSSLLADQNNSPWVSLRGTSETLSHWALSLRVRVYFGNGLKQCYRLLEK